MFVVALVVGTLRDTPLASWIKLAAPLPTSALFLDLFNQLQDVEKPYFIAVGVVVLLLSLLVLMLQWVREQRKITALEQEARDTLMKTAPSETAHEDAA
jgi:hypothetical protein